MFESFKLLGMEIHMYGLLIVLGFAAACVVVAVRAKRRGMKGDTFYLATYALIGGFLGAKVMYLLTVMPEFFAAIGKTSFADFFNEFIASGFVYYGGLIGGFLGAFLYIRDMRERFSKYINVIVPALPLAHAIGRVGCFCAGCCYGVISDGPLAVTFPNIAGSRVPVQLFETAANLLIFAILLLICGKKQKRPVALGVYAILYAVARFILEFYRSDAARGFVGTLSTSQFVGIFIFAAGVALLLFEKQVYGFLDNLSTRPGRREKKAAAAGESDGFDVPDGSEQDSSAESAEQPVGNTSEEDNLSDGNSDDGVAQQPQDPKE